MNTSYEQRTYDAVTAVGGLLDDDWSSTGVITAYAPDGRVWYSSKTNEIVVDDSFDKYDAWRVLFPQVEEGLDGDND